MTTIIALSLRGPHQSQQRGEKKKVKEENGWGGVQKPASKHPWAGKWTGGGPIR